MDLDSEPIDYTNAFLQEMKRRESMGETEYFNDRQLTLMLFDLWVAGQVCFSCLIGGTFEFL